MSGTIKLSTTQKYVWLEHAISRTPASFNIGGYAQIEGNVDLDRLKKSILAMLEQNEIFACELFEIEGIPHQRFSQKNLTEISVLDFSVDSHSNERCVKWMENDICQPLNLKENELVKILLLKSANAVYWYIKSHHILIDGWSFALIFRKVGAVYNSNGTTVVSSKPRLTYRDFINDDEAYFASQDYLRARDFWLKEFEEIPEKIFKRKFSDKNVLNLKYDIRVPRKVYDNMNHIAESHKATMFHCILAILFVVLHKVYNKKDLAIAIPILNRSNASYKETIGLFMGISTVRCLVSDVDAIGDLIEKIKGKLKSIYKYQRFQMADLMQVLGQKNANPENFYDVRLSYEKYDYESTFHECKCTITPLSHHQETDPVSVYIREYSATEDVWINFVFNQEYVSTHEATNFIERFQILVNLLTDVASRPIGSLQLFKEGEYERILNSFSHGNIIPRKGTVIESIDRQYMLRPESQAMIAGITTITYRELFRKTNQIANQLGSILGDVSGKKIGVFVSRTENLMLAILGVLKAGGVYVPLDTLTPDARIEFMLNDSSCTSVIADTYTKDQIGRLSLAVPCVLVEDHSSYSSEFCGKVCPEDLAYIIYTSGSTGTPKGVPISHASLLDYATTFAEYFEVTENERVLQQASVSFDTSVEEIFPVLMRGGVLIIPASINDFNELTREIIAHEVTLVSTNPFYIDYLNSIYPAGLKLKTLISGGDELRPTSINNLIGRVKLYNTYGPTESTVCASYYKIEQAAEIIPIGTPIANREIYILNDQLAIVPVATEGIIYIGGAGLTSGYVKESKASPFIDHPFRASGKLFKTGDVGRFNEDGTIAFLGRKDRQVKISGYRIELDEIEKILARHDQVKESKVVVHAVGDIKTLVAYVVVKNPEGNVNGRELKQYLSVFLPAYMIPASVVVIDVFPLTTNGKIDIRNLPVPESFRQTTHSFVAPVSQIEKRLAEFWKELLQTDQIGVEDNFFELGGNSLKANSFLARLNGEFRHQVLLKDFFEAPFIASIVKKISNKLTEGENSATIPPITRQQRDQDFPVSYAQDRLWFLQKVDPDNRAYFVPRVIRINGELEIARVEDALTHIVARHEILRTEFVEKNGKLYQRILPPYHFTATVTDLTGLGTDQQRLKENMLIDTLSSRDFEISSGRLLRLDILKLSDTEYLLIWCQHHLIHDGWTQGVLIREFITVYSLLRAGQEVSLPELPVQYADYAFWQRKYLTGEILQNHLNYWKEKLSGVNPLMELPLDRPRPPFFKGKGAMKEMTLSIAESDRLRQFSKENNVTLFTTMLAVFKLLLYKITGNADICVGGSFANRRLAEIEGMLGMVINNLPLRTVINGDLPFMQYLKDVRSTCIEALEHEETPLDRIIDMLKIERNLSYLPLFQVGFGFMDTPTTRLTLPGLDLVVENIHNGSAKFDLLVIVVTPKEQLNVHDSDNEIIIEMEFNTDIFDDATIAWMLKCYKSLLTQVLQHRDRPLDEYSVYSPEDDEKIICSSNNTRTETRFTEGVHRLFEQQVAKHPGKLAVEWHCGKLSYDELNTRSNRLASRLQKELGISKGDTVGILADNSPAMLVAIFAILKSGGAYVPIDKNLPRERVNFMLSDSDCKVVLSFENCSALNGIRVVNVNLSDPETEHYAGTDLDVQMTGNELAYVIYTSGSTGKPKGVEVTHHNLINYLVFARSAYFGERDCDRVACFTSLSFDLTVTSIFCPLITGASVILFNTEPVSEVIGDAFYGTRQADVIKLTPSHIDILAGLKSKSSETRLVIVGGEALKAHHVQTLRGINPSIRIINEYGPTECTVGCIYKEVDKSDQVISIGKPIDNVQVHILNHQMKRQPLRVKGNIYIEGDSVARGYLNRIDLTKERFMMHQPWEGRRLYKTGDTGRWLPDGNIEFLGRNDDQVKIRGFRIELGEIEKALLNCTTIRQAVVLPVEKNGQRVLVAFVVCAENINEEAIVNELKTFLPEYMIPGYFKALDRIPLTINGKINKTELKEIQLTQNYEQAPVEPMNESEKILFEVWKDILNVRELSTEDNFFRVGGDSIKVIQVCSRLFEKGYKLELHQLFDHPTIKKAAGYLETIIQKIDQQPVTGVVPIGPVQIEFFSVSPDLANHYNQSVMLHSEAGFDPLALKAIAGELQTHHDMLRAIYIQSDNHIIQTLKPAEGFPVILEEYDYRNHKGDIWAEIKENATDHQTRFALHTGPAMRMLLFHFDDGDRLLIIIHHLVVDGVSWRILLDDFNRLFEQHKNQESFKLPPRTHSFKSWIQALEAHAKTSAFAIEKNYWRKVIDQFKTLLPSQTNGNPMKYHNKKICEFTLDLFHTDKLMTQASAAFNTQINDLLVTALGLAIQEVFDMNMLNLWMEGHGRERINDKLDISRTVGWFTTVYPVVLDFTHSEDVSKQIISIKETLHKIPHKGLGYGLMQYLSDDPITPEAGSRASHILFNYLGSFDTDLKNKHYILADQYIGTDIHPDRNALYGINIWGFVLGRQLTMKISFDKGSYDHERIETLCSSFNRKLLMIIEYCCLQDVAQVTPSDFSYNQLTLDELDSILD
jgi:amino acid adenylation domain-containing protein/non-ribosomal peptide synthase protein (TIGR01720 family)